MSDRTGIETKSPVLIPIGYHYQHRKVLACQMMMVTGVGGECDCGGQRMAFLPHLWGFRLIGLVASPLTH